MSNGFHNHDLENISYKNKIWLKLIFWFSFFMAFPSVLILGLNFSLYIFVSIFLFLLMYSKGPVLRLNNWIQWLAVFFGVASLLSLFNLPEDSAPNSFNRVLEVLPNYIYWCILIILLVTQRWRLNINVIYQGVFFGVSATVIYYTVLQQILNPFPFFLEQSPNNFAFILICYTPIAIYYLMVRKGKIWSISFLFILIIILLRDGRRAGMVLVLLGGLSILFASQFNWKNLLALVVVIPFIIYIKNTSAIEAYIFKSSPRIHEMFYETEKIRTQDRSYLTRVAMVKKGLAIFEKYPYTGIGLNNFSNYSIEFDKSFAGAEYVVHKENLQIKSAHNSYISILSEGGIFLLGSLLLIFLTCIFHILSNYFTMPPIYRPVYIGFLAMSLHLYFISAVTNVFAWFLIGLSCALMYRK